MSGWDEVRREIEALPGPTNEPWGPVSRWSVLAIVSRLAAARGERGLDVERLARALITARRLHEELLVTPTAEARAIAAEYDRLGSE